MNTIQKQFRALKRIAPNAEKKAVFRRTLESRVRADMRMYAAQASLAGAPRTHILRSLFHAPSFALAIVILITSSSGGIAYASQNALPGETLYPVKLTTEKARLTFARNESKKAELHIAFASRRMHEIEELIGAEADTDTVVSQVVAHYERELSEGESLLMRNPQAMKTASALISAAESHKDTIRSLKEKIAARSHSKIHDDLDEAYEHAESHGDTALLTALSAENATSSADALPPAVIEASRKKIRSLEKDIKEKKRALENAKQKTDNNEAFLDASSKLENAEMIVENAKARLENEDYKKSVEHSIEARTLIKEASSWNKDKKKREDKEGSDDNDDEREHSREESQDDRD